MVKKGQKWYAVRKGRKPGIYTSWAECKSQTERFGCAIFKSFKTKEEAQQFINPNKTSNAAIGTNHDQMSTLVMRMLTLPHSPTLRSRSSK